MQLEVGKVYLHKRGTAVKITEYRKVPRDLLPEYEDYMFYGDGRYYNKEGKAASTNRSFDIVAKFEELKAFRDSKQPETSSKSFEKFLDHIKEQKEAYDTQTNGNFVYTDDMHTNEEAVKSPELRAEDLPDGVTGRPLTPKEFVVKYPDFIKNNWTLPPWDKASTDKMGTGLCLIPMYSLLNLGKIFIEGLRYGRDNWKKGVNDKEYQEERLEHAFNHLIKYKEGDRSEDHLAKVMWFCTTQLELERLEKETK